MASVKLNSGHSIPQVGFGTLNLENAEEAVYAAVKDIGYRHVDCASCYKNEKLVGKAFKKLIEEEKVVKREDLFVTSKLWNTHHSRVREACEQTLKDLNLKYLDLYLIHWPEATKFTGFDLTKDERAPKDENGQAIRERVSLETTWKDMEKLVDDGLVKSIGVSNYGVHLLVDLLSYCRIKPATNQVEVHPFFARPKYAKQHEAFGVTITAYSSLASGKAKELLENETVTTIAKRVGKSPAQVCLRWGIERGFVVLPRSNNPKRMKENLDLDFKLTKEDVEKIGALDKNQCVIGPFHEKFVGIDYLNV